MRAPTGAAARCTTGRGATVARSMADARRKQVDAVAHADLNVAAAALDPLAKVMPALKRDCMALSPARLTAGFCGRASGEGGSSLGGDASPPTREGE